MWGSETAETNLRTMLFPCYLRLLGVDVGERDCGDESADDAVTMLFAAVGGRCGGAFTPLTEGRSARDLTQAATSQKKR